MNYYNEFDKGAAAWLRELMRAGLIPAGDVDERDIQEVKAHEVRHYTQCHFFAGISGWPLALRLAGWPEDRPVWSGSCPCPPFSAAGKKKKCPVCEGKTIPHPRKTGIFACVPCGYEWFADGRHLWPEFQRLIAECQPPVVAGEQVSGADGVIWLAGVRATLAECGYALIASDLPAACVKSPNIRQRLWWMAYAGRDGCDARSGTGRRAAVARKARGRRRGDEPESVCGAGGGLADADGRIARNGRVQPGREHGQQPEDCRTGRLADSTRGRFGIDGRASGSSGHADERSATVPSGMEHAALPARTRQPVFQEHVSGSPGVPWDSFDWLPCTDGKKRRVEPGTFPLAHGVPARVVRLRGYGNAINPYVAKEFIEACEEARLEAYGHLSNN